MAKIEFVLCLELCGSNTTVYCTTVCCVDATVIVSTCLDFINKLNEWKNHTRAATNFFDNKF